jgi:hypothetical protein
MANDPERPRIAVDFNRGGRGVVYLGVIGSRASFAAAGIEPTVGLLVRVWDHDLDEQEQPCTIEADAVLSFDERRGEWRANYDPTAMEWIPRATG